MINWEKVKDSLIKFLKEEVDKTGFKKVILGLSGGLDSAIVAVLCKEAFKDDLKVILMPSQFSSQSSISHALELCKNFSLAYELVSIEALLSTYLKDMENDFLRIGNFSARLRMNILYDLSAKYKALVIGTTNKSELLLGYGTIFGDMACAINPIGDIYKSDLYDFARFLNIPKSIINKAPSADFYEGQSDEKDLGYSYIEIDSLLKAMIDKKLKEEELLAYGFKKDFILTISKRIKANEFKRRLPIISQFKRENYE